MTRERGRRLAERWRARLFSIPLWGGVALALESVLAILYFWYAVATPPAPVEIPFAIVLVAVLTLLGLLLSFFLRAQDQPGRVAFAVVFGYVIVGAAIGAAVVASTPQSTNPQGPAGPGSVALTGWSTSKVDVAGALEVRIQTNSHVRIPLFFNRSVPVRVWADLSAINVSARSFTGQVSVGLEHLDPPLSQGIIGAAILNESVRQRSLLVWLNPFGRIRNGTFNITVFVQYNVTLGTLGNFTGIESTTLFVTVEGGEFAAPWYIIFLFAGLLTSFWWRIANTYLEEGKILDNWRDARRIAYMLLLPVFSAIIAVVVFNQLLPTLVLSADPLATAISGFVYGFFWENATKKFGQSVTRLYGTAPGAAADQQNPPQHPPAGGRQ